MKQFLVIGVAIGMLTTAGATAVSTQVDTVSVNQIEGRIVSAEQAKALQARYRYWSSSQAVTLKAPI